MPGSRGEYNDNVSIAAKVVDEVVAATVHNSLLEDIWQREMIETFHEQRKNKWYSIM